MPSAPSTFPSPDGGFKWDMLCLACEKAAAAEGLDESEWLFIADGVEVCRSPMGSRQQLETANGRKPPGAPAMSTLVDRAYVRPQAQPRSSSRDPRALAASPGTHLGGAHAKTLDGSMPGDGLGISALGLRAPSTDQTRVAPHSAGAAQDALPGLMPPPPPVSLDALRAKRTRLSLAPLDMAAEWEASDQNNRFAPIATHPATPTNFKKMSSKSPCSVGDRADVDVVSPCEKASPSSSPRFALVSPTPVVGKDGAPSPSTKPRMVRIWRALTEAYPLKQLKK